MYNISVSRARDRATDYEACSKLEDLNLDVRKNSKEIEERFLTDNFSQRYYLNKIIMAFHKFFFYNKF